MCGRLPPLITDACLLAPRPKRILSFPGRSFIFLIEMLKATPSPPARIRQVRVRFLLQIERRSRLSLL